MGETMDVVSPPVDIEVGALLERLGAADRALQRPTPSEVPASSPHFAAQFGQLFGGVPLNTTALAAQPLEGSRGPEPAAAVASRSNPTRRGGGAGGGRGPAAGPARPIASTVNLQPVKLQSSLKMQLPLVSKLS